MAGVSGPSSSSAGAGAVFVHGTAIAFGARGVLIRGAPGAGKSDLALRALASPVSMLFPEPARLVADDQVMLRPANGGLWMEAPAALAGKIEVRGVGIVKLARAVVAAEAVRLVLVADLAANRDAVERYPDPVLLDIGGHPVCGLKLYPFEASAVLKLRLAAGAAPS